MEGMREREESKMTTIVFGLVGTGTIYRSGVDWGGVGWGSERSGVCIEKD